MTMKFTEANENNLELVRQYLEEQSYIYYNTSQTPELTDEEFDMLLKSYEKFKPFNGGALPPKGKKLVDVSHKYPELVGTVSKVNSLEELFEWISDNNLIKEKLVLSRKFDGNSILVTMIIKDGFFVIKNALTRGKDGKGADLTSFFSHIKIKLSDLPRIESFELTDNLEIAFKCEAVMSYENFKTLEDQYINPRSVVAGLLNSDEGYKQKSLINLIPLRFSIDGQTIKRSEELSFIDSLTANHKVFDKFERFIVDGNDKETIKEIYNNINNNRENYKYMLDGLVVEVLDDDLRKNMGRLNDRNKFDIALKFPYMTKKTKLIDIEFDESKYGTGIYTPVVKFEPVKFNGAICERVSIANYKRFKELSLIKGEEVIIEYRNDVLCYLTKSPTNKIVGEPIPFINNCKHCGKELTINENETFVYCKNEDCDMNKIGRINNYIDKLDIKGIEYNTLEKLFKANKLENILSLYSLTKKDITSVENFLDKSAENIINSISNSKGFYDYEVFGALGFTNVSKTTFKIITTEYDPREIDYSKLEVEDLIKFKGIAEKTAKVIIDGIEENYTLMKKLLELTEAKSSYKEYNKNKAEETFNIVFTGFRDNDLKEELEKRGHKVTSSVSGKTNYLITPDPNSGSVKIKKAREKGINIISIEEAKDLFL